MSNSSTCQEQILMGGTISEERYKKEPYKPLGVIDNTMSIESANMWRRMIKKIYVLGVYFGLDGRRVGISLEPLDERGNTIRDPVLLDKDDNPLPTQYGNDFPYRRR